MSRAYTQSLVDAFGGACRVALVGSALPAGVRVLLLSMAVIDDLGAIGLIAVLFTHGLQLGWLAAGLALCAGFGYLLRRRWTSPQGTAQASTIRFLHLWLPGRSARRIGRPGCRPQGRNARSIRPSQSAVAVGSASKGSRMSRNVEMTSLPRPSRFSMTKAAGR